MIAFITGKVCYKQEDFLILENQGIGYQINFDSLYARKMPTLGEEARIFTYQHVREDDLSLYGFADNEDKQLFQLLLRVSGIGPRMASTIVASLSPTEFALAIMGADIKRLTGVKGVGKKTAERMILELKDKIAKDMAPSAEDTEAIFSGGIALVGDGRSRLNEALAALQVLGYSSREAEQALARVAKENGAASLELDALIKQALKQLATI
ncbi:MAG: Holliday junction branch migration protein RuvA [Eubacteriales bacterium]|nr:Holliday junction branch migration protein RuvA [Eubacteriales bacterium]